MKIKSIRKKENPKNYHIDITVKKNHNFFANDILTHNCNLPARNVVICGVHRGINEVDELDIIQMAGRAGRYGIDDAGFVSLIIPMGSTKHWQNVFVNPRPVKSVLNKHEILAFHALAEIATKEIDSIPSLFKWYSRSLAYKQDSEFTVMAAEYLMNDLVNMEMVTSTITPRLRNLGKVSAGLYYSPYDIHKWYQNFKVLKEVQSLENEIPDTLLSWALGDVPSNNMGYVPRDAMENEYMDLRLIVQSYLYKISFPNEKENPMNMFTEGAIAAVGCLNCLKGEKRGGSIGIQQRSISYDIDRIVQALSWIDKVKGEWDFSDIWKLLSTRVRYGVPAELVNLIQLPGIGAVRAKKLYEKGIKTIDDILTKKGRAVLNKMFQSKFVKQLEKYARDITRGEK